MASYSCPIPAVPKDYQLLVEKRTCVITLIIFLIYFIGLPTFLFGRYKLRGNVNIPCSGCNNLLSIVIELCLAFIAIALYSFIRDFFYLN